jgi:hypothetical protein
VSFYDEMRAAADVMDEVNARFRSENPTLGFSLKEPISPSSMRSLADTWESAADGGRTT